MPEFDQRNCVQNIMQIAKEKHALIGKLEKSVGVSKGYLSRLCQEDNTSKISVDLIFKIAQFLDVPVNQLLTCRPALPSSVQNTVDFIRAIECDTQTGRLTWDRHSQATVAATDDFRYYQSGLTSCPVFHHVDHELVYHSQFNQSNGTKQVGFFYVAELFEGTYIYMVKVQYSDTEQQDYEVYFVTPDDDEPDFSIEPVCSSYPAAEAQFDVALRKLYETIAEEVENMHTNPTVRTIIDRFMRTRTVKGNQD